MEGKLCPVSNFYVFSVACSVKYKFVDNCMIWILMPVVCVMMPMKHHILQPLYRIADQWGI